MGNHIKRIKILALLLLILLVIPGVKKSYSQSVFQSLQSIAKPEVTFRLTTAVSPVGAGQVSPDQGAYKQGTNVILTARALEGWQFDHWSGTDNDNANPTSVTISANKQVVAFFVHQVKEPTPEKSPQPTGNKITVAVYPVKVLASDKSFESLGPVLTSFLVTKLSKSTKLRVTEQEMTAEVEKQLEFANSDKCDATMCPIPEIGKAMAAQKLVVGQVAKLGQKYTANIRVIDIEKKVIDFSVEEPLVCKEEDLDQLMELVALDLREKYGEKVDRPHFPGQSQTSSVSSSPQSASSSSLDSQNFLGIVVADDLSDAERKNYGSGVKIKSISPNSPCRGALEEGNIISYMNPTGSISRLAAGPYQISNVADFVKLASDIKPGGTVGFLLAGNIIRSASCKLPIQTQVDSSQPSPARQAPQVRKRSANPY